MRRASPDFLPHNHTLALRARFTVLLEDPQVILVLPRAAPYVPVQPYGRPPVFDPGRKVFEDRRVERAPLLAGERVGFTAGMQPRVVEDLVRINVAYTGGDLLIQQ